MNKMFYNSIDGFHISYVEYIIPYSMTSKHYHNAYEFFLLMDGTRYVFYDNRLTELKKGDLIILKPFIPHYTETPESKSFKRFLLNVTEEYYDDVFTNPEKSDLFSNIRTGIYHLSDTDYKRILGAYQKMYDVLGEKHTQSKMKIFKMQTACFIHELGIVTKAYTVGDEPVGIKNDNLSNAIEYINSHYTENISLDFIAKYAHMSQSNFCLVFKRETGNTFLNYIQSLRGTKAHRLLLETKMSVGEIAEKTGFSTIQQMERVFNNLYGKTPREMRELKS